MLVFAPGKADDSVVERQGPISQFFKNSLKDDDIVEIPMSVQKDPCH